MVKRTTREGRNDDEEYSPAPRLRKTSIRTTTTEPDSCSDNDSIRSLITKSAAGQKRKGGRERVACDQCSKRRSRCSLEGPACEGCINRGEGDACSYQALLWIDNLDDLPSRQLRRKLDALEALVGTLSQRNPNPIVVLPDPAPLPSPVSHPTLPSDFATISVPTSFAVTHDSLARSVFLNSQLRSADLREGFASSLDAELRRIDTSFILSNNRSSFASPTPLPTHTQAHFAICFFSSRINPVFRLVDETSFFRDCQSFWSAGIVTSPTWLALYFAICAAGFRAAGKEAAVEVGLDEDNLTRLADKCWHEAREVLEGEGFPLASNLTHVQIAIILSLSSLISEDSNIARASTLSSLAVTAALDLDIQTDPYDSTETARMTPFDVEMRRRSFWALYTIEAVFSLVLGRDLPSICSTHPTVRYPLFLSNDAYLPSGLLSPLGIAAKTKKDSKSSTTTIFTASTLAIRASSLRGDISQSTIEGIVEEIKSFVASAPVNSTAGTIARAAYLNVERVAAAVGLSIKDDRGSNEQYLAEILAAGTSTTDSSPETIFLSRSIAMTTAVRCAVDLSRSAQGDQEKRRILQDFASSLDDTCSTPALRLPSSRCSAILLKLVGQQSQRYSFDFAAPPSLSSSSLATPSDMTLPSPSTNFTQSACDVAYSSHSLPLLSHNVELARTHYPSSMSMEPPSLNVAHYDSSRDHVPTGLALPSHTHSMAAPARPLLSLLTSVNNANGGHKGSTPVASPWQDASQTPSRYVGYAWNANLF